MLQIKALAECDSCGCVETKCPVANDEQWWAEVHSRHCSLIIPAELPKGWQVDGEGNLICPTCLAETAELPTLLESIWVKCKPMD